MKHKRAIAVLFLLVVGSGILFWKIQDSTTPIIISSAQAVVPENGDGPFPVYMTLENTGEADTLLAIKSQLGGEAMIMGSTTKGRSVVPAGSKPSFSADGAHFMLSGVTKDLAEGDFVSLTLIFENAGDVAAKALVKRPGMKKMEMSANDKAGNDKDVPETPKMSHDMHGAGNSFEVAPGGSVPEISMEIEASLQNNEWRVITQTKNFEFVQSAKPLAHTPGQGHAHLYLNGLKLQRIYGADAIIGSLPKGDHTVRVTLNTNDHRAYSIQGNPISAEKIITVN
ncbi:MAG: copper chaperone PCu(A)C [Stappiaceae bacterium]